MHKIRLADFILANLESLLHEWEDFARTIEPPALSMDDAGLRDHARQMLLVIAKDLQTSQSARQSRVKSKGLGGRAGPDTPAETHAESRLRAGYTVSQLVSEYRALRASVLRLWGAERNEKHDNDLCDMARFNEAVDQALAESVARYECLVKQGQNMFLAILGHDLRNPLGTLTVGANLIMDGDGVNPRYVLVATRMFSAANRMRRLINDLVDFTRSHLGQGLPVQPKPGHLGHLCEQVVDEARTSHPERQIDLCLGAVAVLPFDAQRMAQVVSNLLGNALQYGSADTPVTVALTASCGQAVLAVNNRGAIIPADRLASIFEPMVRLAADAAPGDSQRNSLGLGLYIAREIVRAHGGAIEVASDIAAGTTFTVSLPCPQAASLSANE